MATVLSDGLLETHKDLVSLKTELQARVAEKRVDLDGLPNFIADRKEQQNKLVILETQLGTVSAIEQLVAEKLAKR